MPDLPSFQSAVRHLDETHHRLRSDDAARDPMLAAVLQISTIHAFECAVDVAIKSLRRFLHSADAMAGDRDRISFESAIELGIDEGIIGGKLGTWMRFRDDSTAAAHSSDPDRTQRALNDIPAFLAEARALHDAIERSPRHADAL